MGKGVADIKRGLVFLNNEAPPFYRSSFFVQCSDMHTGVAAALHMRTLTLALVCTYACNGVMRKGPVVPISLNKLGTAIC